MLLELSISNYALITALHLEFEAGFTVVTGETGAGKSILIGALSLLLGERASADQVRKGADTAVIQGVFEIPDEPALRQFLTESGIDTDENVLIIKREVNANGRSRAFVNGSMVTLNILQTVGDFLVDLHGQHAHQSLFQIERHQEILDQFGQIDTAHTARLFRDVIQTMSHLNQMKKQQAEIRDKLELYQFQLDEIDALDPQPNEIQELDDELKILDNAEKLLAFADQGSQLLKEGPTAVIDQITTLRRQGEPLQHVDPRLKTLIDRLNSLLIELDDVETELSRYASLVEYDPGRAQIVRERLDELHRISRKYGGTLDAVLEKREFLRQQLDSMERGGHDLAQLEKEVTQKRAELSRHAFDLSSQRQTIATKLNERVENQLQDLSMEKTRFITEIRQEEDANGLVQQNSHLYRTTESGIDFVEFMIAPNVGEDLKPLAKIASGGEISRIMLALKTVLTDVDAIPTLIFDEADVGIGGAIAEKVGQKMRHVATTRQVICITHLPMIAALGDHHISVEKIEENGRTVTRATKLSSSAREDEIARMLGGNDISATTRKHARELLQKRKTTPAEQLSLIK